MLMEIVSWLVDTIGYMGYTGIVVLMTVESSFFPFPSEVVIPPAGFLAATGRMDLTLVILAGIAGSLLGAFFNYWMALKLGRPFFERYGKYFFVSHEALERADIYFAKHGHISTFVGRLIPGIRQLISLPRRGGPNASGDLHLLYRSWGGDMGGGAGSSGVFSGG